ncbi:MAG: VCBS repeat-containing protein [Saprospiraceae bacterium]|nr:VCBS repeat-containing protein [Saprospiraceae bacterium]
MYISKLFTVFVIGLAMVSCGTDSEQAERTDDYQILHKLPSSKTNIDFDNHLTTNEFFNTITFDNLFLGSGVGILDVNNDGLLDIYFGGSMVGDRLYLNKGNLEFEDITESANIVDDGTWSTGVAIADVNEDGYDDIYVCKFIFRDTEKRKNHLYINQGDNTFIEKADEWGLADPGYGIMANFMDYDRDGDLDVYVANQPPSEIVIKDKMGNKRYPGFTDRLYRKDGRRFTNVTGAAGITNFNYTLSTAAFDYNKDGWVDIYVASDYEEPDFLWKNNGDGTFTNEIHDAMQHISNFSMGSDIADINRDGILDLYTVDMSAEDNYRQKTNMSGMNPEKFWSLAEAGFHHQYMYNTMQLNNGDGTFSEIAQMGGISSTDWSWAPLFVDFNLDGWDDLMVTNGILKEIRNKDYNKKKEEIVKELQATGRSLTPAEVLEIADKTPSVKILNSLFKNQGDMTFKHMEEEWGFHEPSWTQGAAYADLDNDGDLDLVLNNLNSEADIYENHSANRSLNHYINVVLDGGAGNPEGIGSKIRIYYGDHVYVNEMTPFRGYMSTCQSIVACGVGRHEHVDSIIVIWPDTKISRRGKTEVDQTVSFNFADRSNEKWSYKDSGHKLFEPVTEADIQHKEDEYDDYAEEVLIPHKMSTLGPFVAVADVNNDGSDDFYIGGSAGQCGQLWLFDNGSQSHVQKPGPWCADKAYEDGGAHFFDADQDGDLDLMVTSGGNQFKIGSELYQDRLYINDGNGGFRKFGGFPAYYESSGPIASFDYDEDGDEDLFIGGRQVPGRYGFPASSYLFRNDGDLKFTDVTSELLKDSSNIGMVTDAAWVNFDGRSEKELVMVGEWMPIRVFSYEGGEWTERSEEMGLDKTSGWWNRISPVDVDADGREEFVLGNLGLNIKYKASKDKPFKVYVDDFDDNGTNDVYLGQVFNDGNYYPVRGRQCSSEQMPFIKKEFKNYDTFARTTFENILGERIDSTSILHEAYMFESVIVSPSGSGQVNIMPLPNAVQISPIFDIVEIEVDGDGSKELAVVGNYYNREVETTRSDASYGSILDPAGDELRVSMMSDYGLDGSGDVRAIRTLKTRSGDEYILIAVNNDKVRLYKKTKSFQEES